MNKKKIPVGVLIFALVANAAYQTYQIHILQKKVSQYASVDLSSLEDEVNYIKNEVEEIGSIRAEIDDANSSISSIERDISSMEDDVSYIRRWMH